MVSLVPSASQILVDSAVPDSTDEGTFADLVAVNLSTFKDVDVAEPKLKSATPCEPSKSSTKLILLVSKLPY